MDNSGSMGSPFDKYYYDRFGNLVELMDPEESTSSKTKMAIVNEAVVALLSHLKPDDRIGLVTFSDKAFTVDPLTDVGGKNLDMLKKRILTIGATYGTNMEGPGMAKGTGLFARH